VNSRGPGGLSGPRTSANLHDTDQAVAASDVAVISPGLVNQTRAQFTKSKLSAPKCRESIRTDMSQPTISSRTAEVNGAQFHCFTAGKGPAVILLHGYAETSLM
jgi:hypothetical protein